MAACCACRSRASRLLLLRARLAGCSVPFEEPCRRGLSAEAPPGSAPPPPLSPSPSVGQVFVRRRAFSQAEVGRPAPPAPPLDARLDLDSVSRLRSPPSGARARKTRPRLPPFSESRPPTLSQVTAFCELTGDANTIHSSLDPPNGAEASSSSRAGIPTAERPGAHPFRPPPEFAPCDPEGSGPRLAVAIVPGLLLASLFPAIIGSAFVSGACMRACVRVFFCRSGTPPSWRAAAIPRAACVLDLTAAPLLPPLRRSRGLSTSPRT